MWTTTAKENDKGRAAEEEAMRNEEENKKLWGMESLTVRLEEEEDHGEKGWRKETGGSINDGDLGAVHGVVKRRQQCGEG
ncbi:MAG: hypothetical protein Q8881_02720 [Sweet potato little leaf phytoplasma]|nr:hypothetical protein [Sweet potato little leaf phytoplasma]